MKQIILISSIILTGIVFGQSFGQNKVQYKHFDWSFIESPHFDVYYYGEELSLANFAAGVLEESYEQVSKHLRWELNKRVSVSYTGILPDLFSEGQGVVADGKVQNGGQFVSFCGGEKIAGMIQGCFKHFKFRMRSG